MTKQEMQELLNNKQKEIEKHLETHGNTGIFKPKKTLSANDYDKMKANIKRLARKLKNPKISDDHKDSIKDILKEKRDKIKKYKRVKKKIKTKVSKDALNHVSGGNFNTAKG